MKWLSQLLLLSLLLLPFSSCRTVKKNQTSTNLTTTSQAKKDSTSLSQTKTLVTVDSSKTDSIGVTLDSANTVEIVKTDSGYKVKTKGKIKTVSWQRKQAAIKISQADTTKLTTVSKENKDSTALKQTVSNKAVKRVSFPWWILILIAVILAVYRYRKAIVSLLN